MGCPLQGYGSTHWEHSEFNGAGVSACLSSGHSMTLVADLYVHGSNEWTAIARESPHRVPWCVLLL